MAEKILKYLSRPTSFSIPSTTKTTTRVAFSGPIVPIEARRTKKKANNHFRSEDDDEPTSPKVSCIGQVKHHHHKNNTKNKKHKKKKQYSSFNDRSDQSKKKATIFDVLFNKKKVSPARTTSEVVETGRMRRFASSREAFATFDWRKAMEEDDDDIIVTHSAPLKLGGGGLIMEVEKNRKEVNLWKRRTLSQPEPLQL